MHGAWAAICSFTPRDGSPQAELWIDAGAACRVPVTHLVSAFKELDESENEGC